MKTEVEDLKRRLGRHLGQDCELVINENRSTMLSVVRKRKALPRVSLHKMFVDAPENVISAIAHYVRGVRRDREAKDIVIRGFIQSNLLRYNYNHLLDKSKFVTTGHIYDLKEIYDELNEKYFKNGLMLEITWYGERGYKPRSKITFGQYFDHLRLIKIHRILDDPFYPDYFIRFVVYHEMLHHLIPGHLDGRGLFRVHGKDFKELEREFEDYEKAVAWEKKNKKHFFGK